MLISFLLLESMNNVAIILGLSFNYLNLSADMDALPSTDGVDPEVASFIQMEQQRAELQSQVGCSLHVYEDPTIQ